MSIKSKDSKNLKEFDIVVCEKGFISTCEEEEFVTQEYFQYREIHQIIHHPNRGVEIVGYNGRRRVFYNEGNSLTLFELLRSKINSWMNKTN